MKMNTMTKHFYERNDDVLCDTKCNITVEELLDFDEKQFENWIVYTRKSILASWDKNGCPPRAGVNESDIISDFKALNGCNTKLFTKSNDLTPETPNTVIHSTVNHGSSVDQFFPNMYKVPVAYTETGEANSTYDIFSKDKYLPKMLLTCRRHFKRDGFFHYSLCGRKNDPETAIFSCNTGMEWIQAYLTEPSIFNGYDFWIWENEIKQGPSTGHKPIMQSDLLTLTKDELLSILSKLQHRHISNIDPKNLKDSCVYFIRVYKKGQRIFPKGFVSFRIGYGSVCTNIKPSVTKYLYERFSEHLKGSAEPVIIYDPSMGWAGRLLGAMAVDDSRVIHYVGTDPNTENVNPDGVSKYERVAEYFNDNIRSNGVFTHKNTYHLFSHGSEMIHLDSDFQKYKGKLDIAYTSSPYFAKEQYSKDATQSYVKFPTYDSWKTGFLERTLLTCYEWLKPGGYLLWNIADVTFGSKVYPLEADSVNYLLSLGMKQEPTLQMAMANMSGSGRTDPITGMPTYKNYVKLNGKYNKFEPVFVFRKP